MTGLLVQTIQDYFLDLPDLKEEEEPFADSNWTQILAMFKKEYVESRVCKLYPIMTKLRYDSSESLEDYRESHRIPPNGLLWESTRFRLYGILLKAGIYLLLMMSIRVEIVEMINFPANYTSLSSCFFCVRCHPNDPDSYQF